MKIERTRIHFFSDVFSASQSSDLEVLNIRKEGASPSNLVVQFSCQYDVTSHFGDFSKWWA